MPVCDTFPWHPASLPALRHRLDVKALLLSPCHFSHHHCSPLFLGGLWTEEGGLAPPKACSTLLNSADYFAMFQPANCHVDISSWAFHFLPVCILGPAALTSWSVDSLSSSTIRAFSCLYPRPMDRSGSCSVFLPKRPTSGRPSHFLMNEFASPSNLSTTEEGTSLIFRGHITLGYSMNW